MSATEQKAAPPAIKCPTCGETIEHLDTARDARIFWSVSLSKVGDDGLTWDEAEVQDDTSEADFDFSCPSCGETIFGGGEEDAETFLRTGTTPSGVKAE